MKESTVQRAHDAKDKLYGLGLKLQELASAAYYLGQDRLAASLEHVAQAMEEASDELHACWVAEFDEHLSAVQGSSRTLLEAVLAGMALKGRNA